MAKHPPYEDKPFVVSGDPKRRSGVILAASKEAKKYGVEKSGTSEDFVPYINQTINNYITGVSLFGAVQYNECKWANR